MYFELGITKEGMVCIRPAVCTRVLREYKNSVTLPIPEIQFTVIKDTGARNTEIRMLIGLQYTLDLHHFNS